MKSIGIFVSEFPAVSETFVMHQITSLIKLNYKVKIYSKNIGDSTVTHQDYHQYKLNHITTYEVKEPIDIIQRFSYFFRHLVFNSDARLLFKIIKNNFIKRELYNLNLFYKYSLYQNLSKLDIFIVHFGMNAIDIARLKKMGLFKKQKLIVIFHGYDLKLSDSELNKKRYKEVFEIADLLVVNTNYLKDILLKTKPGLKNIKVLPVGLPLPIETNPEKKKYKTFTVVFCGRLIPLKGPQLVIQIADVLVNKMKLNIHFKIIGEGEMFKKLSTMIKENSLSKEIELTGSLSQENVMNIYQKSHLFILPGINDPKTGRAETQGLVIQEAQYCELPVLVSNAGGMKYGLIDGKTGFVVEQNDVMNFANKIVMFYNDERKRVEFGKAGKEYVINNYNVQNLTQELIDSVSDNR